MAERIGLGGGRNAAKLLATSESIKEEREMADHSEAVRAILSL